MDRECLCFGAKVSFDRITEVFRSDKSMMIGRKMGYMGDKGRAKCARRMTAERRKGEDKRWLTGFVNVRMTTMRPRRPALYSRVATCTPARC